MCKNQPTVLWTATSSIWSPPVKYFGTAVIYFVQYINDLLQSLSVARPYLFAEDTKCMHATKVQTDHTSIQNDIDNLTNYSESWQIKFNISKCTHLYYHFISSS